MKTPNGRDEINAVFGYPANADGTLNEHWEEQNIATALPPSGWQLYYQDDVRGVVPVSGIRIHRKLHGSFQVVLTQVWQFTSRELATKLGRTPSDEEIRSRLHELRVDQHGGGFNFRKITGGQSLSLHAYGIAIDWDPDHNSRQKKLKYTLPDWWYDIWQKNGWKDGRTFPTPDPMHVQFATGA